MKKCPYCGREYSDEAAVCPVDHHDLVETSPFPPSKNDSAATTYFFYRLGVGILVGMIVASVSFLVAWDNAKGLPYVVTEQLQTGLSLEQLQAAITEYQKHFHSLPNSLSELPDVTNSMSSIQGQPTDGWGHPLLYSHTATNWILKTLGRDGQPGGIGLDYDLTGDAPYLKAANLTLGQFMHAPRCQNMIMSSVLCGVLSFGLTSLTIKKPPTTRMGVIALLVGLGLTAFATVFVASFITLLQIPNGH